MKFSVQIACFVMLVIAITSCNKNKVQLLYTNAKEEVGTLGNLTFSFDKNMVPDSLLEMWDSTEYVAFEPNIPGRFRWTSVNELVFSPSAELPAATDFKGSFTSKLNRYSYSLSGLPKLTFHTPYQKLETVNALWTLTNETSGIPMAQLELYFSFPVDPIQLKELLQITEGKQAKNFQIVTASKDSKIEINISDLKAEDRDYNLMVTLKAGLKPSNGGASTKEPVTMNVQLLSPFTLAIQEVQAHHDGVEGSVKVFTSQPVIAESIESYVSLDPKTPFKTIVEKNGFTIVSDKINPANVYQLHLRKGMKGKIGGELKEDYTADLQFGELEPSISFGNRKAVYLTPKGNRNIEVNIINVPKVKLIVTKIYENNLLAMNRIGYYENDYGVYEMSEASDYQLGDRIFETTIETSKLPKHGNGRLLKMDIADKLPNFSGVYNVTIQSETQYYLRESRVISLSDIGLIAKKGKDKMMLFANSIQSATGLSGVQFQVYGANNQIVAKGVSNKDGIAEVAIPSSQFSGFTPFMVTAKLGNDFNYLPFNTTRVETSRFEVDGYSPNASGIQVFVYGDRDMYRPGEKINVNVIARADQWKVPSAQPIKLKLQMPNGKELKQIQKVLNEQGSVEASFDIPAAAITGTYTLSVLNGNDVVLATSNYMIEEFMPDKIRVRTSLDKSVLNVGDAAMLTVQADNLYGTPASGKNYECEIQVDRKYFDAGRYNRFNFELNASTLSLDKVERKGQLNEQGQAKETYAVPTNWINNGQLDVNFFTTVFDESGRPVNRKSTATVYTQPYFLGATNHDNYYCPVNQFMKCNLIALDKALKPVSGKAHVQVVKHEYKTVLNKSGEYFTYNSQIEDKVLVDQTVVVSGENTAYSYMPKSNGEYEIRVAIPGANNFVRMPFYCYGWGYNTYSSFEVNTEGTIDMQADKEKYSVGETANILLKTPFNGKVIVTLERDNVLKTFEVQTDKRSAMISIPMKDEYLPNVYVSATLIKPHTETDLPLTVAHGFTSVSILQSNRHINPEILAPKSVRSNTHQVIKVKAMPNSKITFAAVDEGILQITGFKTPDPFEYFYQKCALGVNSYDMYPLLFPELKGTTSSVGGDGFDLSKRVNPISAKRVKLLTYWSGVKDVNGSGEATFEFDIPSFAGEVRMMAVAYKDEKFGSAQSSMTIADPIVVNTTLPRFLSPGDTVNGSIVLSNTLTTSQNASVDLIGAKGVSVIFESGKSVSLTAKGEVRVPVKIVAGNIIGVTSLKTKVTGSGVNFEDVTEMAIRPVSSLQKSFSSGEVGVGQTKSISALNPMFIDGSQAYKLTVSRSPLIGFAKNLSYLMNYPYGCSEQIVSTAFPQLYFSDICNGLSKDSKNSAAFNVTEAIQKLKMRQTYSGGITLWDDGSEHWYASVYAAHFLAEAKRAGFETDKVFTDNLCNYLIQKLKAKSSIPYYFNRGQNRMIAPREAVYSLYVLALHGKPQVSMMNYYDGNKNQLTADSKYMLACAYAIAGNRGKYNELLPQSFGSELADAETGGAFGSGLRDEALALNVLLDVDAKNPQVTVMSKHIADQLKSRDGYYSTQENVFSILALGKVMRSAKANKANASIKVNGKQVYHFEGGTYTLSSKTLPAGKIDITAEGEGSVYYFMEQEGITRDGSFKQEDNFLKVRKTFYDRYGHTLSGNTFKQNDLIIVGITLENAFSRSVDNVVVTDMLPAGFEIENSRINEIPGMDWIKDASYSDAIDIRDDRVNIFTDANGKKKFYYAVRAVTPGSFHMGPVSADAMYAAEYHSYNGGGMINVVK